MKKLACLVTALTVVQFTFGQTNPLRTNSIDKLVAKTDQQFKTFDIISMYFIFDTGMEGRILSKNTFLDININCKGSYNDEGKAEFYFQRDSLRLIIHYDYDPVEGSASRTVQYYFDKNQLVFIRDRSEEDLEHFEVGRELKRKYIDAKIYFDKKAVIKNLAKTREFSPSESAMDEFEKSPYQEQVHFESFLIENMDKLKGFVKEAWITDRRVKIN